MQPVFPYSTTTSNSFAMIVFNYDTTQSFTDTASEGSHMILRTKNVYEMVSKNLKGKVYLGELSIERNSIGPYI
jgi:hypothetical protein